MPSQDRDVVLISGIVATIQVIARTSSNDELLYRRALDSRLVLEKEINDAIRETLGEGFFVYDLNIRQGSIHFWVVIGAVGMVLSGFSRYDALVKSFEKAKDQVRGIVRRLLSEGQPNRVTAALSGEDVDPDVQAVWTPGESLTAAADRFSTKSNTAPDVNRILLYYLICSHTILMAALIWIVVRLVH
jgi:hypothetical protein